MAHQLTTSYVTDSIELFRYYKKLAERALAQCPDEALFAELDAESNCIAVIVKHMAGNMRSRWKDFLTTDGEKPDRNRDNEFERAMPRRRTLHLTRRRIQLHRHHREAYGRQHALPLERLSDH